MKEKEASQKSKAPLWLRKFREKQFHREWLLLFFWLYICLCEIIVRWQSVHQTAQLFWTIGILPTFCFSAVSALIIYALSSVFSPKVNRVMELVFGYGLLVFYVAQLIYNYKFHFFFSAYSMGNGGQVLEFWEIILKAFRVKAVPILMLILPVILLTAFGGRFSVPKLTRRSFRWGFLAAALALHFLTVLTLPIYGTTPMSPYNLYYKTNDLSKGALQLGLLPAFRLDVQRLLFGFHGGELIYMEKPEETQPTQKEEPSTEPTQPSSSQQASEPTQPSQPIVAEPTEPTEMNVLELDFEALTQGEENKTIVDLHEYFSLQEPTNKNEKTGMFEGCNLIMITAESFSHLAIDPELTPTLYKMQMEGMNFTNFYTAYWGVSTSDGEYVTLTGTIPKSGTWSMQDTADNAMPLTIAQHLKRDGYSAYAYHNHSYTYYHREQSHPNLGYEFTAVGNGLEITKQWPESDIEMIDVTTANYMTEEPFHVYYLTVSGHMEYEFNEDINAIACKNRDLVKDLPYSEAVKAYLACQIELDRALELLLQRLEEAGLAENTVIALTADHYPYGLTLQQLNELAGHEVDTRFEIYRNACIIYKKGMTPETVDKPCSSLDYLPTLCNLFGVDYDSRLYMGTDAFSDAERLILFSDRSWLTEFGSYYTLTGEYSSFEGTEASPEMIDYYNSVVANKFLVSQWILENDYWRCLFPETPLPEETESIPQTK